MKRNMRDWSLAELRYIEFVLRNSPSPGHLGLTDADRLRIARKARRDIWLLRSARSSDLGKLKSLMHRTPPNGGFSH
jgi:hypothetical protein